MCHDDRNHAGPSFAKANLCIYDNKTNKNLLLSYQNLS